VTSGKRQAVRTGASAKAPSDKLAGAPVMGAGGYNMAGCKAQAKQIDTSTVYEQPRKDHNGDRADGEAGSPTVVTRTSCAHKKNEKRVKVRLRLQCTQDAELRDSFCPCNSLSYPRAEPHAVPSMDVRRVGDGSSA
jgi:hypothetical protein